MKKLTESTQKVLIQYANACNDLKDEFIEKYFDFNAENYWVADKEGEILVINDYFFDMETMELALEKNVKPKWLFEFYDWGLEAKDGESRNLNYFLNLKKLKQV